MKRILHITLFLLFSLLSHAQFGINDVPSMEAMIGNHKMVRTVLEVRAIAELGAYNLHCESRDAVEDYRTVHNRIDKYKRCFDIIDLILNGTATAYHGIRAYNSCKRNINGYVSLLDDYVEKILLCDKKLLPDRVWVSDSIIYTNSVAAIDTVRSEVGHLFKSYYDLATYMTGAMECSTSGLMAILNSINTSLDNIDAAISNAYLSLWSYMTIRLGYWKKDLLFTTRTVRELADSALVHWFKSQNIAFRQLRSPAATHITLGGGGLLGGKR